MDFLWRWGDYSPDIWPLWEQTLIHGQDDEERFAQDIFPILQRAVTEGDERDRVFALFLAGGLATPKARDLLISFLHSPHRKERWASAISLGRLKEERVFALLQTLLLEGFSANEIFASVEELQAAQKAGHLRQRTLEVHHSYQLTMMGFSPEEPTQEEVSLYERAVEERKREEDPETLYRVFERLEEIDYEWYLRQRSECALVLGAWGKPVVVPKLKEALRAAWKMEQDWPNYEGPDESGPGIWHFFQDRLVFALGQLGVWDALLFLRLPQAHLLFAKAYLILGYLQISDPNIFEIVRILGFFDDSPEHLQQRAMMEETDLDYYPFIDPAPIRRLLAEHVGLSSAEQDDYLLRFRDERISESQRESPLAPKTDGDLTSIEQWELD